MPAVVQRDGSSHAMITKLLEGSFHGGVDEFGQRALRELDQIVPFQQVGKSLGET